MENESTATVLRRVRKLLALATSTNEHEAALAAAKAQEIAERAGLDWRTVGTGEPDEPVGEHSIAVDRALWRRSLLYGVARAHGCDGFETWLEKYGANRRAFVLVGPPRERATAEAIYYWLVERLQTLSRGVPARDRASYLSGAVAAVLKRLREARDARRATYTATERALVVVPEARTRAYMAQHHANLRTVRPRRTVRADAYSRGYNDGQGVALGAPLTHQQRRLTGGVR